MRAFIDRWGRLLWGASILLIVGYIIVSDQIQESRSEDRDAARAYQRCEQSVPPTTVLSAALEREPGLAAHVHREAPGVLTQGPGGRLHLEVPDCAAIYPRGAEVSDRFPDVAPSRPVPTTRSGPSRP